jgi:alkylation response protein AidB-like acyl-CoA dehydrogenase
MQVSHNAKGHPMADGMNLGLSAGQQAIKDQFHLIAREDLLNRSAEVEREGLDLKLLTQLLDGAGIAPATLLEQGAGDPHTLLVAVEELAYGDAGIGWAAVPAFQIATILGTCGTAGQRRAARDVFGNDAAATASVLLYEDFGRQPSELETRITRTPEGWTAAGHKSSVAYPHGADISLLVGREGDELAGFCFTGPRPGLTADRDDREAGKIAITAVPSGPVSIEGLTVTADERLAAGPELHRAVGQARLLLAAALIGVSRASLEFCAAYAVHRTTWGKPLAQYQGVSFPLIEHATELEEVRLLVWDVAARLAKHGAVADIERQVSRAVNRASSLGLRATRDGVQLIGVRGITRDLPAERWYRAAAVLGAIDFDVLETPFGLS